MLLVGQVNEEESMDIGRMDGKRRVTARFLGAEVKHGVTPRTLMFPETNILSKITVIDVSVLVP